MHKAPLSLLLAIALALVVWACTDTPTSTPDTVSVSGTVLSKVDGTPVEGAKVDALRVSTGQEVASTTTDSKGAFKFDRLPKERMDLLVSAQNFAPIREVGYDPDKPASGGTPLVVQMAPPDSCCSGSVTVTVTNASNQPLNDAKVQLRRNGVELGWVYTNAQGIATFDSLCPGVYNLRISKDGFAVTEPNFLIDASCNAAVVAATLQAAGTVCCAGVVTVTIKDVTATPVAGALVKLWKDGQVLRTATTNSSGVASFDSLCTGKYGVSVNVTGMTEREANAYINANCDPYAVNLTLEPLPCCSGSVTVTVRDSTNTPIAGAKVQLRRNGKELTYAMTNAQGVVVFDSLCAGTYNLRISKDGFAVQEPNVTIGPDCGPQSVNIGLAPLGQVCCTGVLTVTVKDATGNPIAGATVKLWKAGVLLNTLTTNANGVVSFTQLCKGEYGVDVIKDTMAGREFSFAIGENCEPVSKTITLEPTPCCSGVFTVTVKDGQGNAVAGATVQIKKAGTVIATLTTGVNGQASRDGLCKAEYTYRISKDGLGVAEGTFSIDAGCTPVTKEVTLPASVCCTGVFTLTVKDAQGNPIAGAKVYLKKAGTVISDPVTNANGQVVIDGLCAGEYTYKISKDAYNLADGSFAIDASCTPVTREATLQTLCCSGAITVTVKDTSGNTISGATVKLWKGGTVLQTTTSNANGVAGFDGLCQGNYALEVIMTGYSRREVAFTIDVNCTPVTKTAVLEP
jgi:protocatechuate 3,4-dioxygenase beta subunit